MTRRAFTRNDRLSEELRRVLTELIVRAAKDPRLDSVTVSGVRLSADRSHATVFVSVIGDDERERQALDGLHAASPFLRRELGRVMHLRTVPELGFKRDTSYAYGDRMERLLDGLQREREDDDSESET